MRRIILSLGFLMLAVPLVMLALHNVLIPVLSFTEGRSVGTATGGIAAEYNYRYLEVTKFLSSLVIPLPPQRILEEWGVVKVRLSIVAENSSITVYKLPIEELEKVVNSSSIASSIGLSEAKDLFDYLNKEMTLGSLLPTKYTTLVEFNPTKAINMIDTITKKLNRYRVAEGSDEVTLSFTKTGKSVELLIIYTPNANEVTVSISVYARFVRHLSMAVFTASLAIGSALMSVGIAMNLSFRRKIKNIFA